MEKASIDLIVKNAHASQFGGRGGCCLFVHEGSIDMFAKLVAQWSQRCGVPMLAETSEDGTALAESSGGGPASAGSAEWFDIPTSTWRRRKEDGEVLVSDPVPRIDRATGLPLDPSAFQASKRAALERWRG